jgi:hypothetical protein
VEFLLDYVILVDIAKKAINSHEREFMAFLFGYYQTWTPIILCFNSEKSDCISESKNLGGAAITRLGKI